MHNYMNEPVTTQWTDQDIINCFQQCKDKKTVSRIYQISVPEVTKIIKESENSSH